MRRKFCLLLLVLLGLPNYAVANREICGAPPPEQFRDENNESIKGDLEGKANLLSRFVGQAELGGKIESTRKEIFAKYSDANAAYMDRYLLYMFCFVLFDPKNKQTPQEKMKAIQEFLQRQQQQPAEKPPINTTVISNNKIDLYNSPEDFVKTTSLMLLGSLKTLSALPPGVIGIAGAESFCDLLRRNYLSALNVYSPTYYPGSALIIYRTTAGMYKFGGYVSLDTTEQLKRFDGQSQIAIGMYMQRQRGFEQFAGVPINYVAKADFTKLTEGREMLSLVLKAPESQ